MNSYNEGVITPSHLMSKSLPTKIVPEETASLPQPNSFVKTRTLGNTPLASDVTRA